METSEEQHQARVAQARATYGEIVERLRFPDETMARIALEERARLLDQIGDRAAWGARSTKLDCTRLSPGCRACVEGGWSCLFINGRCNARCFYCPSEQDELGVPMTNTLPFPKAGDYVEYVERFGFTGVSISGGEPLLSLDRTLTFLRAVKQRLGEAVHLWLYTNGLRLDSAVVKKLRQAGLDEIRLDLGACRYKLDAVHACAGVIPTVTVEVPAIPEDYEGLRSRLADLASAGVHHLNLHQLKATPHNLPHLHARGYCFLMGGQLSVLESELTALRLLAAALDQGLDLPVNYCSFVYKERFQRAAARRIAGQAVRRGYEDLCESGLLRQLVLDGEPAALAAKSMRLRTLGVPDEAWSLPSGSERLLLSAAAFRALREPGDSVRVLHVLPRLVPQVTYRFPFVEVHLGRKRTIAVERLPVEETLLHPPAAEAYARMLEGGDPSGSDASGDEHLQRLVTLESIESGLQDYMQCI